MNGTTDRLLRALVTRVRWAEFAIAFVEAVSIAALGFASTLLFLRLFGTSVGVDARWFALLGVPLAWACWRATRVGLSEARAAAWLDHKLGLGGLLATSLEAEAGPWKPELEARLAAADRRLPRLDFRKLGMRLAPAFVVLALVAALPQIVDPTPKPSSLVAHALDELGEKIEELAKQQAAPEEVRRELEKRLEALRDAQAKGEPIEWADVDSLREQTSRALEQAHEAVARLEKSLQNAATGKGAQGADSKEAAARLEDAMRAAQEAGLTQDLPKDLAKQLEGMSEGSEGAKLSPEERLALAENLQKALEERRKLLEQLDPAALEALRKALEEGESGEMREAGELSETEHEHTEECEGGH